MSLSRKGEGGTIVLKEILLPLTTTPFQAGVVTLLSFLGVSFFIGDGVITPAISVLSAVEGLTVIPGLQSLSQQIIIFIACLITIFLFVIQSRGVEKISVAFGPLMLIWFLFLGISGAYALQYNLTIFKALNPFYGIKFLISHGFLGFMLLSKIILCATGAEALYADMGHLGRKPIIGAWVFVFGCLVLAYMGQGVFLMTHPNAQNLFYEMIFEQTKFFYVPVLILSIGATVIASQAMVSGIFAIVYQGITTRMLPRLRVAYTSRTLMSQIYIPFVNWFLLLFVLLAIINFKYSFNLASAYGLAASATMTITSVMLSWIYWRRQSFIKAPIATAISVVNGVFLCANLQKIPAGGYWSLLIALVPFLIIVIYTAGQRKLYGVLKPLSLATFKKKYQTVEPKIKHIEGTAVWLSKTSDSFPSYIANTMFINTIMYENNVIVCVIPLETPFGVLADFEDDIAPGLRLFKIKVGYMEHIDIQSILTAAAIHPKVVFYGMEEITSTRLIWHIFIFIKKISPSFVQFYGFPSYKLHGVVSRVTM
jgi:KUP system potassium uptake protein